MRCQVLAIPAAHPQPGSVLQDNEEVIMRPRLEFLNAFDVYDCSSMNARKSLRIELSLQYGECLSNEK